MNRSELSNFLHLAHVRERPRHFQGVHGRALTLCFSDIYDWPRDTIVLVSSEPFERPPIARVLEHACERAARDHIPLSLQRLAPPSPQQSMLDVRATKPDVHVRVTLNLVRDF
jgi:hypothetical protein